MKNQYWNSKSDNCAVYRSFFVQVAWRLQVHPQMSFISHFIRHTLARLELLCGTWHDSSWQLLQIYRLHIHNETVLIHHIRRCSSGLRSGDCGTNVMDMVSNQFSCRLWRLNDAQLVLRDLKGAMKYLSTSLHHHYQPELSIKARMDPYFDFVYAKFCPYHSNVSA